MYSIRHLLLISTCIVAFKCYSAEPQYTRVDSIKVVKLLEDAEKIDEDSNMMIHFARQLRGIPYVSGTLDKNKEEQLVVNLRQLDCTTYVENVLALTLCNKNNKNTFADFCRYLQSIRYHDGTVSYINRLHYFSDWISHNMQNGYVKEVEPSLPPFNHTQTLNINYMSTHPQAYPMLVKNPKWIKDIAANERKLTGKKYWYISKFRLQNIETMRALIPDGTIIAIVTNKKGLDVSHVGIAVWHKDGLHLLNASSLHHKVVEEPRTLRDYMIGQDSQMGVRIVKLMPWLYW